MSGIPYLGSKISLISKSEIRYEGILIDVNAQDSTITFEQVRFFGTEGRRPGDEIAPMDKVFDCVVFRSADIKDLQVYETPKEEKKQAEFVDPAVVSFASTAAKSTTNTNSSGPSGFQYQSSSSSKKEEVKMPKSNDYASAASSSAAFDSTTQNSTSTKSFSTRTNRSNYSNYNANANNNNSSSNYNNSSGNYNNAHNTTRHTPRGIVVPKSEFDFSQSNAKFSKDEIAINEPSVAEEQSAPSYNKNLSFFDDISCQANSESARQPDRNRMERNLNMETFGQSAPPRRYHRGGRGRGGYYRGGSGNRGGYNSNYNSSDNTNSSNDGNSNRDQN